MLQNAGVWHILTCKCASRHSGVPFLHIGTSKSGPSMWCFAHFDLKMCFSTSELQKVIRPWGVLYILTYACVFRHSGVPFFDIGTTKSASELKCFVYFDVKMCGVQFLISPLTTWLRTRRSKELTFRLTRHTNHWKSIALPDFSNIWRVWMLFLLTFALLHFFLLTSLHLICFHLLFNSPYCRKFTI